MVRWSQFEQGSDLWLMSRCGALTASRFAEACEMTKKGESEKRRKLKLELLSERLTKTVTPHFINQAMKDGTEREPLARDIYQIITEQTVEQCGFALHPNIDYLGASPDGLVGTDGLIEIKCPTAVTYLTHIIAGVIPEMYIPQMTLQLLVTQRKWCDIVIYHPSFPEEKDIFIRRFVPTAGQLSEAEDKALLFLAEVDALHQQFMSVEML